MNNLALEAAQKKLIARQQILEFFKQCIAEQQEILAFPVLQQILIHMLKTSTSWSVIRQPVQKLFFPGQTIETLSGMSSQDVYSLISEIPLAKAKSTYFTAALSYLHDIPIPDSYDTLIQVPGIGRKTARRILAEVYFENNGASPSHILRVIKRTRLSLKRRPDRIFADVQHQLGVENSPPEEALYSIMRFGQKVCKRKRPNCKICPISRYCPSTKHY